MADIENVEAVPVKPEDDPTKFYFEIEFIGKGSPWKLRAHSYVSYMY